jgi:ribosome-binding factor A
MRSVPSLTFTPDALPENAAPLDEVLARASSGRGASPRPPRRGYAGEADPYKKPRVARTSSRDLEVSDEDDDPTARLTREVAPRAGRRRQGRRA